MMLQVKRLCAAFSCIHVSTYSLVRGTGGKIGIENSLKYASGRFGVHTNSKYQGIALFSIVVDGWLSLRRATGNERDVGVCG